MSIAPGSATLSPVRLLRVCRGCAGLRPAAGWTLTGSGHDHPLDSHLDSSDPVSGYWARARRPWL